MTHRSGGADPDGSGRGGPSGSLWDGGQAGALLRLGLRLGQDLLRHHHQLTRLDADQNHT